MTTIAVIIATKNTATMHQPRTVSLMKKMLGRFAEGE